MNYAYITVIVVVVALTIGYIVLKFNGKTVEIDRTIQTIITSEEFKALCHSTMIYAEKAIIGSAKGKERLEFVAEVINTKFPLVPKSMIISLVELFFKEFSVERDGHIVVE